MQAVYIPTGKNPADELTRGVTSRQCMLDTEVQLSSRVVSARSFPPNYCLICIGREPPTRTFLCVATESANRRRGCQSFHVPDPTHKLDAVSDILQFASPPSASSHFRLVLRSVVNSGIA